MLPALLAAIQAASAPAVPPPAPMPVVPSPAQIAWHRLEFYGFVHFSVNTFTDREWGMGDEDPSIFEPTELDCREWARVAKEAGMRGLILTAKHHDGFCLWPSRFTKHSVASSRWRGGKGDVVRELADACREEGVRLGLYLSPWDCNHTDYGRSAYVEFYRNQLTELLTEYGPIFEVWFDGANGGRGYYGGARGERRIDPKSYYEWPKTFALVRKLAPHAVVFSDAGPDVRWIGNEAGAASAVTWQTIDTEGTFPGAADESKLSRGDPAGARWVPPEADVSIRPGWFYHAAEDDRVKSPSELVDLYFGSVGRGANLLLNVPPDRRGHFHENDVRSLRGLRAALDDLFAKNRAAGAHVAANAVRGSDATRFGPTRAVDGDPDTYWALDDGARSGELTVTIEEDVDVRVLRVEEAIALGQRVQRFAIDAHVGGAWRTVAEGETIGPRRLFRIEPVRTRQVRLRVLEALAVPCIAEFAIY